MRSWTAKRSWRERGPRFRRGRGVASGARRFRGPSLPPPCRRVFGLVLNSRPCRETPCSPASRSPRSRWRPASQSPLPFLCSRYPGLPRMKVREGQLMSSRRWARSHCNRARTRLAGSWKSRTRRFCSTRLRSSNPFGHGTRSDQRWQVAARDVPSSLWTLYRLVPGTGLRLLIRGDSPVRWERSLTPARGKVELQPGDNFVAWAGRDGWDVNQLAKGIGRQLREIHRRNTGTGGLDRIWPVAEGAEAATVARGEALWVKMPRSIVWLQPTDVMPRLVFPRRSAGERTSRCSPRPAQHARLLRHRVRHPSGRDRTHHLHALGARCFQAAAQR